MIKMKYAIVYLLKGEVEKYHQKIVRDVSEKFGVKGVLNFKVPSHITLKYLSKRDKIKDIEKLVEEISRSTSPFYLTIGGIGNFDRNVIF